MCRNTDIVTARPTHVGAMEIVVVRFRVDGVMHAVPPKEFMDPVVTRIKVLACTDEHRASQTENSSFVAGENIDVRVSRTSDTRRKW